MSALSIADVKRDLPDVPVRIGGRVFMAKLSGRLCDDATLTVSYVAHGDHRHLCGRPWVDAHFSWAAVTRAVNSGSPLEFDS